MCGGKGKKKIEVNFMQNKQLNFKNILKYETDQFL